jgi:hypothetical protein
VNGEIGHANQGEVESRPWNPVAVSHGGLSISHLLKADDVILFSSASTKHCRVVHD